VLLIRRIRELLYEEGFTISGARNRLDNSIAQSPEEKSEAPARSVRTAQANGVDLSAIKRELRDIILTLGA
jgi:hypothetical protein